MDRWKLGKVACVLIVTGFLLSTMNGFSVNIIEEKDCSAEDLPDPRSTETDSFDIEKKESKKVLTVNTFDEEKGIYTLEPEEVTEDIIETEEGTFSMLSIPDMASTGEVGKPQLPYFSRLFAVPNTDVSVEILDFEYYDKDVGLIFPAQELGTDSGEDIDIEFAWDEASYSEYAAYPKDLVEILDTGKIRAIPFARVGFYPVQYFPADGIARIYTKLQVKITWDPEQPLTVDERHKSRHFDPLYENSFQNWKEFQNSFSPMIESNPIDTPMGPTGCEYLIITDPDLAYSAGLLQTWKAMKGMWTEVVDTTETGTTNTSIRAYIENVYSTWIPVPSYILFLGDVNYIPTNYLYDHDSHDCNTGSDLWYVNVSGTDYYPDFYYGRIPAATEDKAYNSVMKIIHYEQDPPSNDAYYDNVTVAAFFEDKDDDGYSDRRFVRTTEEMRDYLLTQGYNVERVYNAWDNRTPTNYNETYYWSPVPGEAIPSELLRSNGFAWDGGEDDLVGHFRNGQFAVFHRDHGARWGWGAPYLDLYSVYDLENYDQLSIVFSINCQSGWFDHETDGIENTDWNYASFAESFILEEDEGAAGVFASTRSSYSGYNDYMSLGFFDAIWPNFDTSEGSSTPMYNMGQVLNYGKTYMANTWGDGWGYERAEFEQFHYFGDPSTEMWTTLPEDMVVTHTATLSSGESTITVDGNIDGAIVSITIGGDIQGTATVTGGSAVVDIPPVQTGSSLTVTVTEHGHRPYIGKVTVPSATTPDLAVEDLSFPLTANAGDDIDVSANIVNNGPDTVTDIMVQLHKGYALNTTYIASLASGEYQGVTLGYTDVPEGEYEIGIYVEIIPLESNEMNNWMNGTFFVDVEPEEDISDTNVDFGMESGEEESQNITITNTGLKDLDFKIFPSWKNAEILVYTDVLPYYSIDALRNLGLSYVLTTNMSGPSDFSSSLTGGTDWDLVIFNSYTPEITPSWLTNQLMEYLMGGGNLIYSDDSVNGPSGLTSQMRYAYDSNFATPNDVYKWDATHPIFNTPNAVPDLTWSHNQLLVDGQKGDSLFGGQAIAGYTLASSANEAAIVINSTSSIFNGFQPINFQNDDDTDNKKDMIELYENEIFFLLGGCHWLTLSPKDGSIDPSGKMNVTLTVNTTNLAPGFYQTNLTLISNDPDRETVIVWVNLTVGTLEEIQVPIQLGWNFISTPFPCQDHHSVVLSDIAGKYDRIMAYNPTDPDDPWKVWNKNKPAHMNDLSYLNQRIGFWLDVSDADDGWLRLTGVYGIGPHKIVPLANGWNLVGYQSDQAGNNTIMDSAGLPSGVTMVKVFDPSRPDNLRMASMSTDEFILGRAYWLYSTDGADWTVP